jgi:hypothetical protein
MSRTAEIAAQNLLNVIQDSDYRMTPARDEAKTALLTAIATDYPHLPAADVYDNWTSGNMASIRAAAAYTQQIIDDEN